ncbi:MAG: carboxypeptidase regulatory-like domain-containing protein [Caldilineaceae bacterium]|nr:carboxypeptidase regulatory-like domain-containing protein [Caldilineaceae bacterium]
MVPRHYVLTWMLICWWLVNSLLTSRPADAHPFAAAQAEPTGQVSGMVISDEHHPIASVQVQAYTDTDGDGTWQEKGESAYTRNDGTYTLCCLVPGIYRIGFTSSYHDPEFYDNATTVGSATDVQVTANVTTADINAELAHKGRIRGHVTDQRGEPINHVWVRVYPNDGDGTWSWIQSGETGDEGAYTVEGLDRGTYRVAFAPGYGSGFYGEYYNNAATIEEATDIFVDKHDTVYDIDAVLEGPTGRIQGTVKDEGDQPIAGAIALVQQDSDGDGYWSNVIYDETDERGFYMVAGLADGTYRVQFLDYIFRYKRCSNLRHIEQYYDHAETLAAATDIVIEKGKTQKHIDANLAPAAHIRGTVTDLAGTPVSAEIIVTGTTNDLCFGTNVERDGSYDVGVDPGSYYILFYAGDSLVSYVAYTWEFYNDVASEVAATPVTVGPRSTVADINAQLAPGGTIRGTVTGPDNLPLPQIQVTAYTDEDGDGIWQPFSTTQTDAGGAYAIPGVGGYDGVNYRIGLRDLRTPPQYHPDVYGGMGYPENGTDVTVGEDQEVTGIDSSMVPYGSINYAPLARPDHLVVTWDAATARWVANDTVLANDVDAEAQPLQAVLIDPPEQGTFTLNTDGSFLYVPAETPWSSATFTYRADDGNSESDTVTVTILPAVSQQYLPIIRR